MSTQIVQFIHHLSRAKITLKVFCLGDVNVTAKRKFKGYIDRIDWLIKDLRSEPNVSRELSDAIEQEYSSDVYTIDAIAEKSLLLTPDERETVESIIDSVLKGEPIEIVYTEK